MNQQPIVLFLDPTEPELWDRLAAAGFDCRDMRTDDAPAVFQALAEAFGVVIRSRFQVDRAFMDAAPRLAFIARSGVGVEHIDLAYAAERGIAVITSPEGSKDTVGEHTLGLLLMLMNNLARADREVRQGQWIRGGNRGYEIKGKTVGIVGYGNMGQAFAQRLLGFGCAVVAYDKYRTGYADTHARAVTLAELQQQADIVSLHIPYMSENHHWANATFFAGFSKPIWVVNTARGLVLDTAALVQAMGEGRVAGAALDVIEYEDQSFAHLDPQRLPMPFQQLLANPNVVLTPHIAGWSFEAEAGHARVLADKILEQFQTT